MTALMNRALVLRCIVLAGLLIFFFDCVAFPDEWKARHPLVSPTGVMNLSDMPPPSEIFFSGPEDPANTAAWLDQLRAWRTDRRIRLRYDGSQFERPELEWTQHVFSQVQLLIWDLSFYDPE